MRLGVEMLTYSFLLVAARQGALGVGQSLRSDMANGRATS
jgi:hypothetical protein